MYARSFTVLLCAALSSPSLGFTPGVKLGLRPLRPLTGGTRLSAVDPAWVAHVANGVADADLLGAASDAVDAAAAVVGAASEAVSEAVSEPAPAPVAEIMSDPEGLTVNLGSGAALAASQQLLALAVVVLGEGLGGAFNSSPKSWGTAIAGAGGAGLLVACFFVMGSSFEVGAYAASAVSLLLSVSYVIRIIKPYEDSPETSEFIEVNGEFLPPPTASGKVTGWPKEFIAFSLAGCFFGTASFLTAANYVLNSIE
eukprot:CAMPEP_0172616206 /NCGR_PEP_ID=MMETSP1068-20121228/62775_1 /TAXON_ID=35684 /ORGANISM="Pseudopedinella elastica, Strain CCMP716" /LENGTH=254 /DNA_ID=CAMNT_0013421557 /DNA_START=49 /DNA_END=813 /DNA_ORIENTATION=-